jgi:hypothetical protein
MPVHYGPHLGHLLFCASIYLYVVERWVTDGLATDGLATTQPQRDGGFPQHDSGGYQGACHPPCIVRLQARAHMPIFKSLHLAMQSLRPLMHKNPSTIATSRLW